MTSAEVSDWTAHDSPFFVPLVEDTAQRFTMRDVTADKAYIGRANVEVVEKVGGTPYILPKVNSMVTAKDAGSAWERLFHRFALDRDAFMEHYHLRSNIESTFGAIKAKFGSSVRSKSDTGQRNECKILAHNITVVILAMETLGIEPEFGCTTNAEVARVARRNS